MTRPSRTQGPDFEGQICRLRGGDGVHFTTAGALKLAHYAEHDLRRLLSKRVVRPVRMLAAAQRRP